MLSFSAHCKLNMRKTTIIIYNFIMCCMLYNYSAFMRIYDTQLRDSQSTLVIHCSFYLQEGIT